MSSSPSDAKDGAPADDVETRLKVLQLQFDKMSAEVVAMKSMAAAQDVKIQAQESKIQAQELRIQAQKSKIQAQATKAQSQDSKIQSQGSKIKLQESRIESQDSKIKSLEETSRHPRNLVVCIDGTSNQFSVKNTNVVELYHRLIKDETQLTFYNSGIGTYATPSWRSLKYYRKVIYNKIDLAIAWNFDAILLSAYRWLVENYEDGDIIYLFGFSRGAYQVRTLAAMIDSVGLLHKGNQDQVLFAYELYADTKGAGKASQGSNSLITADVLESPGINIPAQLGDSEPLISLHSDPADQLTNMRVNFKKTLCRKDVKLHFVGAWDTVSSVGLVRDKTLPGTTDGMKQVTYFRHALALHERRVKFLQENSRGGLGPKAEDTKSIDGKPPHTKEVWFAGSHGDIGGGVRENIQSNRFGPALRWMIFEATVAGLRFIDTPQTWEHENISINNTLSGFWRVLEYIPFTRLAYTHETKTLHWPHLHRPRVIAENQLIHETAAQLMRKPQPHEAHWCAQSVQAIDWEHIGDDSLEPDPYTAAKKYFVEMDQGSFHSAAIGLQVLLETEAGRTSLRDIKDKKKRLHISLHKVLEHNMMSQDAVETIRVLIQVMEHLKIVDEDSVVPDAQKYAKHIADRGLSMKFMELFGSVGQPLQHPDEITCITYMPNGNTIVTGCDDGKVRLWDLTAVTVSSKLLIEHTDYVRSVAVSQDGAKVASGSDDKTVCIWNAMAGEIVLLEGHTDTVRSVAFSHDGSRIMSGSSDRTIRVWDTASGQTVVGPIEGHTHWIRSVTFSLDELSIVSGSVDNTIRVWNAGTGEALRWVHMGSCVFSMAYSPDGRRIVAGCSGGVCIVDVAMCTIVLGPLTGHSSWVTSVALSPDGTKIASGSGDDTAQLSDAQTGQALDVFRGHRNTIWSIAFSPDGKCIASASEDNTVRIWDATGNWKRVPYQGQA